VSDQYIDINDKCYRNHRFLINLGLIFWLEKTIRSCVKIIGIALSNTHRLEGDLVLILHSEFIEKEIG